MRRAPAHARLIAALLAGTLLWGCASAPPPTLPDDPAALQERYQADLADCRAHTGHAGVLQETLDFALQGALVAAMLAWGAGGDADTVRGWAWGGAALVGTSQGLQASERRRQAVARCMLARGHGGRPYTLEPPQPVAQVSPAAAVPTAPPTGADGYSAERLALSQACHTQPRAQLVAKGPGFETYSLACSNGDALAIRCEFGNCRVLR